MSAYIDTRCQARTTRGRRCRVVAADVIDHRGLCAMHAGMAREVAVTVVEAVRESYRCGRCGGARPMCAASTVTVTTTVLR